MAFSDNIWWTRKAKIQTANRLLNNACHANLLLLWYSFCSTATAIYYLNTNSAKTTNDLTGVGWAIFSVLALCIAGFINGLTYKERAGLVKACYEALDELYKKAKRAAPDDAPQLSEEYAQILGSCENHTDRDYYLTLCIEHVTNSSKADKESGLKLGLDRCPTWFHWAYLAKWYAKIYLLLFFLYALPILLFLVLEKSQ